MIEVQTFTEIDTLICKMVDNDANTELLDNNFIKNPTYSKSINKPEMEKQIGNMPKIDVGINTARYYEISDGAIHESFSTSDDSKSDTEIISQNQSCTSTDIIVVISDDIQQGELMNLYNKLKNRLKYIIHYGSSLDVKHFFERFVQIISVDTLAKAVNKSHLLAKDGQTIFFPKVSSNFDFFGHVNLA